MAYNLPPGCTQNDIDRAYGSIYREDPYAEDDYDESLEETTVQQKMNELKEVLRKSRKEEE